MPAVQQRRGTAAELALANEKPLAGQIYFETDTNKVKIGDGERFYNQLPYLSDSTTIADIDGLQATLSANTAAAAAAQSTADTAAANAATADAKATAARSVADAALPVSLSQPIAANSVVRWDSAIGAWVNSNAGSTLMGLVPPDGWPAGTVGDAVTGLNDFFGSHAGRHSTSGPDPILPANIGAATAADLSALDNRVTVTEVDIASLFSVLVIGSGVNTDPRLSDARTPTAHAATHGIGGSDQILPADIGAAPSADPDLTGTIDVDGSIVVSTGSTFPGPGVTISKFGVGIGASPSLAAVLSVNGHISQVSATDPGFGGRLTTKEVRITDSTRSISAGATGFIFSSDKHLFRNTAATTTFLTLDSTKALVGGDLEVTGSLDAPHAATHAAGGTDAITPASIGAQPAGSYATLVGGTVPASQLPSYVDDVIEGTLASFPATGDAGKIYVDTATNLTYRWSGSQYVEIASSPGSTDVIAEGVTNLYYTDARVLNLVGTTVNTICAGNDGRLSDARTPVAHTHTISDVTGLQASLDAKANASSLATVASTGDYADLINVPAEFAPASHTHSTSDLTDVSVSSPATGQYLRYVSLTQNWVNSTITLGDIGASGASLGQVARFWNGSWGPSTLNLSTAQDVSNIIPSDGQVLTYDAALALWRGEDISWNSITGKPATFAPSSHTHAISDLTQSSATSGQVITWDGTAWVAATPASGGAASIGDLTDVAISSPAAGEVLRYDGTTFVDAAIAIGDVTNLQATLDAKAATSHTHAISDVTNLQTSLDAKAATSHNHAIGDVTNLQTALDAKANTSSLSTIATTGSLGDCVDVVASQTDGQVLAWNANQNRWRPAAPFKSNTSQAGGGTAVNNVVVISQAAFDALATKDANTIYFIT